MSKRVEGDKRPLATVRYALCPHEHDTQVMFGSMMAAKQRLL